MSIMCCVYVPEGIVMAADSRLTRTKPTKDPVVLPSADPSTKTVLISETTYTLSDNTQKVPLIKKVNVGVSFCGNAIIDGMTVADFIRRFEIEKVSPSDTTEEVARKLSEYYKGNGTHFFVCRRHHRMGVVVTCPKTLYLQGFSGFFGLAKVNPLLCRGKNNSL